MRYALPAAFVASTLSISPGFADNFQRVTERDSFVQLTKNRPLTRFGIKVQVTSDGGIVGKAFGQSVTGDWSWKDGYFCRDLYLSGKELDLDNCQTVEVRGDTLRFTSDRGTGDSANLELT